MIVSHWSTLAASSGHGNNEAREAPQPAVPFEQQLERGTTLAGYPTKPHPRSPAPKPPNAPPKNQMDFRRVSAATDAKPMPT